MKHQPFEDWLVSGEPLDRSAEASLAAHLATCEACRDLRDDLSRVEAILGGAAAIEPAPEFLRRWEAYRARRTLRRRREGEWFLLAAVGGLALLVSMVAIFFLAGGSPGVVFGVVLQQFVRWALWVRVLGETVRALAWNVPLLSVSGYAFLLTALVTAAGGMFVAWYASIRRFSLKGVVP